MNGTHAQTGLPLSGTDHLRQSIVDILTTPIGSRVMRRDYGSRLFELVDKPLNAETLVDMYAATAEALNRWEGRLVVKKVSARSLKAGSVVIDLIADLGSESYEFNSIGVA